MSSKTKIVVLRMKEIIYTAIFVGLAILFNYPLFHHVPAWEGQRFRFR